jgi:hypothetical protein
MIYCNLRPGIYISTCIGPALPAYGKLLRKNQDNAANRLVTGCKTGTPVPSAEKEFACQHQVQIGSGAENPPVQ